MKKSIGFLLLVLVFQSLRAQNTRYIIRFTDKGSNPYSLAAPSDYLSSRAMARRIRFGLSVDSTDLPVTPRYLDSVRLAGTVTILNVSRWLNEVSIQTTDNAALAKINSLPFVAAVSAIAPRLAYPQPRIDKWAVEREQPLLAGARQLDTQDFFNYGSSFSQVHIHHGEFLHNIGLRGQNIVLGMLDAGFFNYQTLKVFDSVRTNGQILGTWDFVNREASVNEDNVHGMECFSTIASNLPGQFVGTAPKAAFYLFRSEDASSEYPIEEHNWVCAAERLDSAGGDMISSSLGYNTFDPPFTGYDHSYADMNGNTTRVAIGADLAARKGILVVNSAGNEGTNSWKFIDTPADGDSVLAVGAVTTTGSPASFSSYGPSSDGQVKPDVASVGQGTIVAFPNDVIGANNGTSFSAPNLAGLAACLWQGFPEFSNMQVIDALRRSGSRYANPDNRVGYGIPDMRKALLILVQQFASASATVSNCRTTLSWTSKDASVMRYEIERKLPGEASFTKVQEVSGTGTVFGTRQYNYQESMGGLASGSVQYRILQVVDTSTSDLIAGYIDTVSVNVIPCTSEDSIILMPNPSRGQFSIRMTTATPYPNLVFSIYNAKGQLVERTRKSKGAGIARFEFSSQRYAAGKYFVIITGDNRWLATRELLRL